MNFWGKESSLLNEFFRNHHYIFQKCQLLLSDFKYMFPCYSYFPYNFLIGDMLHSWSSSHLSVELYLSFQFYSSPVKNSLVFTAIEKIRYYIEVQHFLFLMKLRTFNYMSIADVANPELPKILSFYEKRRTGKL